MNERLYSVAAKELDCDNTCVRYKKIKK